MIGKLSDSLIENKYNEFREEISLLFDYLNQINDTTKKNIKRLLKEVEYAQNPDTIININEAIKIKCGTTLARHLCSNPYTGSTLEIGNSAIDLEEKIRLCNTLKNKQYQWVITEAYELLEDYIEAIYVYIVCVRNDLWSSSDFGKVEDDEIGKREVYYRLLKAKSNPSKKITKIFRNKIPGFKEIETNNKIGKNYRFNIKLIELLRHTIVHNSGRFNDTEKFINKVLDESEINGKKRVIGERAVRSYITKVQEEDIVMLLERPSEILGSFGGYFNRAKFLLSDILEYSLIIKEELKSYLGNH